MPIEVAMSTSSMSFLKQPQRPMRLHLQRPAAPQKTPVESPVSQHFSAETKSGSITLIAPNGRRQGVNVIVYHTSLEHFAVIYPQKKICRPLGVINLKNVQVERLTERDCCDLKIVSQPAQPQQQGFRVRQVGFDTPMTLTFLCEDRDLVSWMDAFGVSKQQADNCTKHTSLRHQNSLPIVEEDEEQ